MIARRVIGNEVDDDVNPSPMCLVDQHSKIIIGAVVRIDVVVVGDIVAVIAHRLCDRHQPDAIGAETRRARWISIVDVVETRDESAQISDAITIRVSERAYEYLVAHAIAPPRSGIQRDCCCLGRECAIGASSCNTARDRKHNGSGPNRAPLHRRFGSHTATATRESAVP